MTILMINNFDRYDDRDSDMSQSSSGARRISDYLAHPYFIGMYPIAQDVNYFNLRVFNGKIKVNASIGEVPDPDLVIDYTHHQKIGINAVNLPDNKKVIVGFKALLNHNAGFDIDNPPSRWLFNSSTPIFAGVPVYVEITVERIADQATVRRYVNKHLVSKSTLTIDPDNTQASIVDIIVFGEFDDAWQYASGFPESLGVFEISDLYMAEDDLVDHPDNTGLIGPISVRTLQVGDTTGLEDLTAENAAGEPIDTVNENVLSQTMATRWYLIAQDNVEFFKIQQNKELSINFANPQELNDETLVGVQLHACANLYPEGVTFNKGLHSIVTDDSGLVSRKSSSVLVNYTQPQFVRSAVISEKSDGDQLSQNNVELLKFTIRGGNLF